MPAALRRRFRVPGAVLASVLGALSAAGRHPALAADLDPVTVQREWDGRASTQTAAFSLKTNLPGAEEARLVDAADALLDETGEALGQLLELSPRGPHRFRLSVFATTEEYRAYVSAIMTPALRESMVEDSAGFYSGMRNEIVMACPGETFKACRPMLVHEFCHALAGRTVFMSGGERVTLNYLMPPWLDEGLAEYVSAQVTRDPPPPWGVLQGALKAGTLPALAGLIDPHGRPLEQPFFYPSAWSLVTLLIEQDPGQLKRYVQVLKTRRFATDQFASVFGDPQELEPVWQRFIAAKGK